jgi:pimeloyl-ACP methyl ester carboxylesterase
MVQQLQRCEEESLRGGGGGGSFRVHVLPRAGHWLHTDNPDGLHAMLHEGWGRRDAGKG